MSHEIDVTGLLNAHQEGDEAAAGEVMPVVYEALRRIAHNHLYEERAGYTFSTTDLVHEAYLKLVDLDRMEWQSRSHFFAMASRSMRCILVDYARKQQAQKRGGDRERVPLEDAPLVANLRAAEVLDLDAALDELAAFDERKARVVQYRFFGGLTIEEAAEVLDVSPATVGRDWTLARAWLRQRMSGREP